MKKLILISLFVFTGIINAQFKGEAEKPVNVRDGIINNSPSSLLLGFINPDNLQINHSMSMSYTSFGNQGIALGVYTGSLMYKFNDKLDLQIDASVVNTPYSSYGQEHADHINGVYLSRAQLNYRPSEDMHITIQFNRIPYGYYRPYYRISPFGSSMFNDDTPFEN
ncbi:hypothetical protein ACFLTH_01315 [Bacteroidota bacterium]